MSLQNCSVVNQSAAGLQVECIEGFDGGLPQVFYMEVLELPSMMVNGPDSRSMTSPLCKKYQGLFRYYDK